jgi:hypothetical protein
MSNDYVKVASHQCPVCGVIHQRDVNELLLHKQLRDIKGNGPNGEVVTGISLCEEHYKLYLDGYVALLVTTDEENRSEGRTGEVLHIRNETLNEIFHVEESDEPYEVMFISPEVYDHLVRMMPKH